MNRNVIFVLCVVVGITALLLVGKRASKPSEQAMASNTQSAPAASAQAPGDPPRGSMAPAFELKSVPDGKLVPLSSLRGKAVLLNFWATWCGPCKIEIPWFKTFETKYKDRNFSVLGVAMDDADDKEISDFAHKMGVNYMVLKGTEKVGDLYGGVDRLPLTYFIDRSGKVVDETVGLVSESIIEDAIKRSLGEGAEKSASTTGGK